MQPDDALTNNGFCLAKPPEYYVFYFPRGGANEIDLTGAKGWNLTAQWFDTRFGVRREGPKIAPGKQTIAAPGPEDWILLVRGQARN
jgi:hypothetical protein